MQTPDLSQADTTAKLLLHNAAQFGGEVALREKAYGIWHAYSWADSRSRVQELAQGLLAQGIGRGDVVGIIGRNRPHWLWAELAAQAAGAMSLGIYEDALATEVQYLLGYAEAKIAFVEDEEQADKVLEVADQLPALRWVVYNDPRGLRKYQDPRLLSREQLIERGKGQPAGRFEQVVAAGRGDDVAMLCTTSGTTAHPKLAMLQHRPLLEHVLAYLRAEPRAPSDEYVSILPLPWIVEQVYVAIMPLLSRTRVNFPEDESTVMQDLREIGPTHVLFAPRVWEQISADVHSRLLDANRLNQAVFNRAVKAGLKALDEGRRSWLADRALFDVLRDRLGFSRIKSAATGGSALGPDTFRFFLAMGVPLRQLYGQTEAAGAYTIQTGGELDFDSSGLPFDDTEIRIHEPDSAGLGEVWVRHRGMFKGYFKQPDETRKTMTEDGWLKTGDAGYLDAKGRLVVTDRIRDIATTATGIRFSPQFIENKLKFSPYIGECVVLGNGRPAVTAILCVRFSMVAKWAEASGLAFTTYTNLSTRPEVYDLLAKEVDKVNRSLPPAQRITRFLLLYKELDADDGELTRTRKVRRGVIDERYRTLIEALYSERHQVAVETEVTFEDGRTGRIKAEMAIRDMAPEPTLVQEAAE
ncbi:MAG: AMP-dependent synthetase [Geminicoccaceae bacterium]|nr:AMP-dependent synthetase [Geminicoccaceae bacterium]